MATVGRRVGRMDIRLVRGDSETVGARWRRRDVTSGTVSPVDLTGWTGQFELRSPDGGESWYSLACAAMTSDGYAQAFIPPSAFIGDVWAQRRQGQWRIRVTSPDGGTVRTLAWGYFALSD